MTECCQHQQQFQYYQVCDTTLVQSEEGMQLPVKEGTEGEVKHQIPKLIVNWISLLFTNIFLRFFKPYFSDPPGYLLLNVD